MVESPNVGCFLRLHIKPPSIAYKLFFSIYLLIITLNNYIYNTTEKKHFNNSIAMALAMRKAGKDATAKKQHYKVERS